MNDEEKKESIRMETLEIIDKEIDKITESFDHHFKMITLGSASAGKTCFLARYFKNIFENSAPTLTVDFFTKSLKVN